MTALEEARAFFAQDKYATAATGTVIEAVGERYAKCSLKIAEHHKNALGQVMGGVMYTLADFTFAVATNFRQNPTVTVTSTISYPSAVKGDTLYAESFLMKDGRSTCYYRIEIRDNLDNLVAIVMTTGMHLQVK